MTLSSPQRGFVSHSPAATWEEALLSGNGVMGAMVLGSPLDETIILSHERLFLPINHPLPPPDTASHLTEIRRMLAEGKYQEAADFVCELALPTYGEMKGADPFMPACDLRVRTGGKKNDIRDFGRGVDFSTGVTTVRWEGSRGAFERRLFVSRADDVAVLSIKGPAGALNCRLWLYQRTGLDGVRNGQGNLERGIRGFESLAEGQWLTYLSRFNLTAGGYACLARVIASGGQARVDGNRVDVVGADDVLVLARIYPLADFGRLDIEKCKGEILVLKADFENLLARHVAIHGELFNRVSLDLGGGADRSLASEELLARAKSGDIPPALLEKEFDACRYEIISSSGRLPPALQGVWTGTWGPPWSGDYTFDGNVQSAIAATLSGNTAELMEGFFGYVESLVPDMRTNARVLYGCRGILMPSHASSHGLNNHFNPTWPLTFWTAGAAWAGHFFYDYWLYTGDRDFLARRAIPFMKEAAAFYEDFLIEGPDGKYVFNPSYSPENNPANRPSQACVNAAMDMAACRILLTNLVAACRELGVEAQGVARWSAMLAKLPDYRVNADGAVKEWLGRDCEDNYAHRHCSHLYPLFAGLPADIAARPALVAAFQVAIDKRRQWRAGQEGGGNMAFGLVQLALAASSLGDGQTVSFVIDRLCRNYFYPSLATMHNPGAIFNVDIGGGLPALIIKALVHSEVGRIELLPALPSQVPAGRITGVRCRGRLIVEELDWSRQEATVRLLSPVEQTVTVKLPRQIDRAEIVEGGAELRSSPNGENCREITLPVNQIVKVRITMKL